MLEFKKKRTLHISDYPFLSSSPLPLFLCRSSFSSQHDMYSSISTLFVILTVLLTHSFSAQLNPKKSSTQVFIAAGYTSNSRLSKPRFSKPRLSKRGDELFKIDPFLNVTRHTFEDVFDPIANPNGIVNLGTAENVCFSSIIHPCFWSRAEPAHWPLFQYIAIPDVAEFVNRNVPSRPPLKISSIFGPRQG